MLYIPIFHTRIIEMLSGSQHSGTIDSRSEYVIRIKVDKSRMLSMEV
jgi:hypothetical protein